MPGGHLRRFTACISSLGGSVSLIHESRSRGWDWAGPAATPLPSRLRGSGSSEGTGLGKRGSRSLLAAGVWGGGGTQENSLGRAAVFSALLSSQLQAPCPQAPPVAPSQRRRLCAGCQELRDGDDLLQASRAQRPPKRLQPARGRQKGCESLGTGAPPSASQPPSPPHAERSREKPSTDRQTDKRGGPSCRLFALGHGSSI